jgi:hypothetical protein
VKPKVAWHRYFHLLTGVPLALAMLDDVLTALAQSHTVRQYHRDSQ